MPAATGVPVHGKDFFKRARNRLSFEAFNTFLAGIKRLNNQQQSREATLESAHWWFEGRPREGARHAMHASVLPFLDGGSRCRQRWASCAGADSRRLAWSFSLKRNTCTARDGVPQTSLVALGLEIRGARAK